MRINIDTDEDDDGDDDDDEDEENSLTVKKAMMMPFCKLHYIEILIESVN